MRLTLRTMLAYLDDILDAADAKELSRKIDESKFAGELVHRIRNSTRRLRLGAPRPEGKGMGLDPNTVAEYLDNTMPPEHVPDFEKVCLESDVHLAEVASCHQILTLVLGEPAEVEHAIRKRIYGIGKGRPKQVAVDQAEGLPPHVIGPHVTVPLAGEEQGATSLESFESVIPQLAPSHRQATGFPFKSLAITVVLAFSLALVGLRAMGEFNASHPLWRLIDGSPVAAVPELPDAAMHDETTGSVSSQPSGRESIDDPSTDLMADGLADESPQAATDALSEEPLVPSENRTPAETGQEVHDRSLPVVVDHAGVAVPALETAADTVRGERAEPTGPEIAADSARHVAARPTEVGPAEVGSSDADPVGAVGAVAHPEENDVTDVTPSTGTPAVGDPVTVGRYLSENQLLARFDVSRRAWFRVAADSPLSAGDQFVVLPTYRPQVLLQSGLKMTVVGSSYLSIRAPVRWDAETEIPQIWLAYGRALVIPAGDAGSAIQLDFGGRQATLQLDTETSIAVDVRHYRTPGSDSRSVEPTMAVRFYVPDGHAQWHDSGGAATEVGTGQMLTFFGDEPPLVHDLPSLPTWIRSSGLKAIERRASQDLLELLSSDRRLILSLMEQAEIDRQRRVELRALANRSLMMMGFYTQVLETLEDERHRAYWGDYFDSLLTALTRGPQAAADVLGVIDAARPTESETLFRLLNGYSPKQLEEGSAAELVGLLEHPLMSIRVLASLNLKSITGMTKQFYPNQKVSQSRGPISQWQRSLAEGRVSYKVEPSPFPEVMDVK